MAEFDHQLHLERRQRPSYPRISASLLAIKDQPTDEIVKQCLAARRAGVDLIHFDVVAGGRKTAVTEEGSADTTRELTPSLLCSLKRAAGRAGLNLYADVHVMDMQPNYGELRKWIDAGAEYLTVHWEAYREKTQLRDALQFIGDYRVKGGLALRPDSDVTEVSSFVAENRPLVQLVSQLGVLPCLGGQVLVFSVLRNIRALREFRQAHALRYDIMVDGGVEPEIAGPMCFREGADILVAGSAFFGRGRRDQVTLRSALDALKLAPSIPDVDVYDIIAERILEIRQRKTGKVWVCVEGYHGGGKTFATDRICESLFGRGITAVPVGLDLSWTDRRKRANWKNEAAQRRAEGLPHNYFDALSQEPEPMHWRKAHSDAMLAALEQCQRGEVVIDGAYQFDLTGGQEGKVSFHVAPDSVFIVEGVYASALARTDWDLKIYLDVDQEKAKQVASVRDAIKVRREPSETRQLYEEVYENSYRKYLVAYAPRDRADIVIELVEGDQQNTWKAAITHSSAPLLMLQCTNERCREQTPISRVNACCRCGHELRNEILGSVDFLAMIDTGRNNMWRYHRLLPVDPDNIVTAQEGFTPVRFLPGISERLGVQVWGKLETQNPTGTFKDREAAYVMSCSKQFGGRNVVMQSTGNTAIAIAYYSGVAEIVSWCFIPRLSAYKLLMPPKSEFGHLIAVDGHPIDVKAMAEDFAACFGYPKISPFYERCEANRTMAYEVAEDFLLGQIPGQDLMGGRGFDFYVQTLSAGMGLIGFHAGMEVVEKWTGGAVRAPRMAAIEISEFAPVQKAWDEGLESVGEEVSTPFFPDHELFEPTLWTTNISKYYPHLRRMLKSSNGILESITPDEVNARAERYGFLEELCAAAGPLAPTEKAPLIGLAGLAKLVEQGAIPRGSNVLVMVTGKGLHDGFVREKPDFVADPRLHKPFDILRGVQGL
jgi:threonine synthase